MERIERKMDNDNSIEQLLSFVESLSDEECDQLISFIRDGSSETWHSGQLPLPDLESTLTGA